MRHRGIRTLASLLAAGAFAPAMASAQQMVINEISVGDPEFVEVLILEDGDYQNWAIVDSLNSGTVAGGGIKFIGPGFASLQAGTLITVYAEGVGLAGTNPEDLSYDPGNGDWDLTVFIGSTSLPSSPTTGDFAILGDIGMILGATGEAVLIGDGTDPLSPYNALDFIAIPSPAAPYYDPQWFKFAIAAISAGSPHDTHTEDDIDLPAPINVQANAGTFTSPVFYDQGITTFTPGQPNTVANQIFINSLRGVSGDNPDAIAPAPTVFSTRTLPNATSVLQVPVENAGASASLVVSGSFVTGADAALFTVSSEPTVAATGAGVIEVTFDPAGSPGRFVATLNIVSNDQSGDVVEVQLVGHSGDPAAYAGLYIMEVTDNPTADEFIEVQNTSGAPMDISGVIVSDEETGTGEGVMRFPTGTVLAAGERVVVALGNSDNAPSWLDIVPAGVRIFHEPARDPLAIGWFPANGNTIIAMEDVDVPDLGLGGTVFLASDDGLALYLPGSPFVRGPVNFDSCIDGVNWNNTSTIASVPINSNGDLDTQATRATGGAADPAIVRRLIQPNTNSELAFRFASSVSPGAENPADDPDAFVPADFLVVERSLPNGTSTGRLEVQNVGAAAPLTISGSTTGGPNGALFSFLSEPAGIPAGSSGNAVVQVAPAGALGFLEATLNINSNDQGGDIFNVPAYSFSGDPAAYNGLWLSEVSTTPTRDEFIEITNQGSAPLDISGVQVTDSHDDNFEGTLAFPAGTTIAPGEFIVIAVGNDNVNKPTWLDGLPGSVRVFYEPARRDGAEFWFPANGNQLTEMVNVAENEDADGGTLFLGGSDNVALMFPGARIFNLVGPVVPSSIIDGMNIDNRVTLEAETPMPINPTGQRDTQETRLNNGFIDTSAVRVVYETNTGTSLFWAVSDAISPGLANPTPSSVDDWTLMSH